MIRLFKEEDLGRVIDIWFNTSVICHSFIKASYWESQKENIKNIYLPNSNTYVYIKDGKVVGFISLVDSNIAALFVDTKSQGEGIGTALVRMAQKQHKALDLTVYKKNINSLNYYKHMGFHVKSEQIDINTGEYEFKMVWESKK